MKAKISAENSKLGKLPNISLSPIKSCVNCSHCSKLCYALKAYRMYPPTKKAWDHNLDLAKNHPKEYFQSIQEYVLKKNPKFFRWHVSGDILDQRYLSGMIKIARDNPETTFLAFTKNFSLDYRRVPQNLSIVFSMWPKMRKPVHKKGVSGFAWMQDGTEKRVPENAVECPGDCEHCGMCFHIAKIGGNVVFHKH